MLDESSRLQYTRFPTNLTRAMLRAKNCTEPYLSLGFSILDSSIDLKQRELIILRIASISNCAYERMQHVPLAKVAGWTDREIYEIESGSGELLDVLSKALLAFVNECTSSVRVSNETYRTLAQFYSEEQITHATLLIGFFMMTARFLETLEVELDDASYHIQTNAHSFTTSGQGKIEHMGASSMGSGLTDFSAATALSAA
ncbi:MULTISPECIES: carboxymuconolactone decarboxylase family protein [Rhizobium]|uniref:carboxymuconolactone decarboxylase family protein n=1 Tax=Rhizobium TaxID=379 RepID=UPI001C83C22E|nr:MULTISPECIES: carboxymuconolactone decarboxylase family protein [Rhizobium]MBX4899745.1 carboxymuconolactone decarboxylase family protein [Rhizobium bangladeshense]MBX5297654.1 carboxymuconolactone decarboxylase family protein [Rhizobium sp. NLR15a]MBY3617916.1 carboxymuconolactone decarboxylase family protein [Rhizobium bangladeshense]